MKTNTKLIIWAVLAVVALALCALVCINIVTAKTYSVKNPVVTFELENYGNVKIELYPEYAPNTVSNFINLVNKGFYTGKVLYGKDATGVYGVKDAEGNTKEPTMSLIDSSITAGSDEDYEYQFDGEIAINKFEKNTLKHEKGTITMLRQNYPSYFGLSEEAYNSASCHFQIMVEDNRNFNGLYAAFGKVIEGLDIVEKIYASETEAVPTTEGEEETSDDAIKDFVTPATIKSASVETYGIDYGKPEVHKAFDYNAFIQSYFNQ